MGQLASGWRVQGEQELIAGRPVGGLGAKQRHEGHWSLCEPAGEA